MAVISLVTIYPKNVQVQKILPIGIFFIFSIFFLFRFPIVIYYFSQKVVQTNLITCI